MGYDLHITRKTDWSDEDGPAISEQEWRGVIEEDPELKLDTETRCVMPDGEYVFASWNGEPGALGYHNGEITTKNPTEPLIRKMVAIAQRLGANVQGDDGEVYQADGTAHVERRAPARASFLRRVKDWFGARRNAREWQAGGPAFKVGSRVHDSVGRHGTVTNVDRHAEHGMGRLSVRFDDGNEVCYALIAPGVELDGEPAVQPRSVNGDTPGSTMLLNFDDTIDRLSSHRNEPASAQFRQALDDLRILAEGGHVDAAQALAYELALYGVNHDPEAAYKWYYISLSQQGYSVGWEDHNHTPPYYCGPVGDFRNESMVSDLVVKLGWERVRQLDRDAAQWLAERRGT